MAKLELAIRKIIKEAFRVYNIVICEDCEYFHTDNCAMDDFHFMQTNDKDFCSRGKRRGVKCESE